MTATDPGLVGDRSSADGELEDHGPAGVRPDVAARHRSDPDPAEAIRAVVESTQRLFEKHVELARQEMVEAVEARILALVSASVAGVTALFAVGFLASALAHALDNWMAPWGSRLVVAGLFLVVTAAGALLGKRRLSEPPAKPEATIKTLKEDVEWARARMRR